MKRLCALLTMLCLLCAPALADSLVTNGGVSLDTASLPHNTEEASTPVVYFISDISADSLVKPIRRWAWSCPARWGSRCPPARASAAIICGLS